MFNSFRENWAYRRALKAVSKRRVKPWPSPAQRRVLVVMPTGADNAAELWRFVGALDVPAAQVHVVSTSEAVGEAPAAFIGQVQALGEKDLGFTGLPKRAVAETAWRQGADVAIDLHRTPTLVSLYLVGASPATFRLGYYQEEADPFFDVMFNPPPDQPVDAAQMQHYLEQITPPILPFSR